MKDTGKKLLWTALAVVIGIVAFTYIIQPMFGSTFSKLTPNT